MNTPIPPEMPLVVTLEAQQWNAVMAALSEAPYRIAYPLIQAMTGQMQSQVEAQTQASVGNGLDDHHDMPRGRIPEIPADR